MARRNRRREELSFDRTKMFSRPDLMGRGWTDSMIRKFLPSEDANLPNPKYVNAGDPMKLYERKRVERIESSDEFQDAKRASEKRKISAQKAVETKRSKLDAYVRGLKIEVPMMEKETLISEARQNFRTLCRPDSVRQSDERKCVNYLRHCCTKYETELEAIAGKTGAKSAYYEIKEKVLCAIADHYDWLAEECDRQMDEMNLERRESFKNSM